MLFKDNSKSFKSKESFDLCVPGLEGELWKIQGILEKKIKRCV